MDRFTGPGTPLTRHGFAAATTALRAAPEALWAVLSVETSGCGFLPDRRPKILFERHFFHRLTRGRFDATNPAISGASPGGYGAGGANQYDRLGEALRLDEAAALASASWGIGQIMGANHAAAGFANAAAMVVAFTASEDAQLAGMTAFIVASKLAPAIEHRRWADFARGYNGPDYAKNRYDERLAAFCRQFAARGVPDVVLRAAQVLLTYLGADPGGIDGFAGAKLTAALRAFQGRTKRAVTGRAGLTTLAALTAAVDQAQA